MKGWLKNEAKKRVAVFSDRHDAATGTVPDAPAGREAKPQVSFSTTEEPRFPHGYEARLKVAYESPRPIGRLSVFFVHESNPFVLPVVFVETQEERDKAQGSFTLVSVLHDARPTGRYRLQGGHATYPGDAGGVGVLVAGLPPLSFVLTDRRGGVLKPLPDAPKVTGATWE